MAKQVEVGRWRFRVWKPQHPTRFGTHRNGGIRTFSARWFMCRIYKVGAR